MIKIFTIGFTKKTASEFFGLLQRNSVNGIVDTRINNTSQLAGYAKGSDLAFFLEKIGGMDYRHEVDFAPTKELLAEYRKKEMSWPEYETAYLNLLDMRKVDQRINVEELHQHCLLCSEHGPEKCHRRLLAEYFQHKHGGIEIVHLVE